jgi:hypothetical protein
MWSAAWAVVMSFSLATVMTRRMVSPMAAALARAWSLLTPRYSLPTWISPPELMA